MALSWVIWGWLPSSDFPAFVKPTLDSRHKALRPCCCLDCHWMLTLWENTYVVVVRIILCLCLLPAEGKSPSSSAAQAFGGRCDGPVLRQVMLLEEGTLLLISRQVCGDTQTLDSYFIPQASEC